MAWSAESLLHDFKPVNRSEKQRAIDSAQYAGRRWDAENNLSQVAFYADQPNAQHLVALNAEYMLDRKNQGRMFLKATETKNAGWKPELIKALTTLVKAGTLTPETLTPELGAVISTFRNRYPSEEIPASVQPIFDVVPQASLKSRVIDRFITSPSVTQKLSGGRT
jgi:hypothetical protein